MQAYGWSLPAKTGQKAIEGPQTQTKSSTTSHVPVPVPVYCRPLMEKEPGMKVQIKLLYLKGLCELFRKVVKTTDENFALIIKSRFFFSSVKYQIVIYIVSSFSDTDVYYSPVLRRVRLYYYYSTCVCVYVCTCVYVYVITYIYSKGKEFYPHRASSLRLSLPSYNIFNFWILSAFTVSPLSLFYSSTAVLL